MEPNEPNEPTDRHELTCRPIAGHEELGLFNRLPYVLNENLASDLATGRRRPEWLWVAVCGDRLLARVGWWSRPGAGAPFLLDVVDVDDDLPASDRVAIGTRLLRTAMAATLPPESRPPEYLRFLPPGWRIDDHTRDVVRQRMAILERAGARLFVERLRLERRPETPVAEPSGRLAFRPVRDTAELLALMTRALDGTLDAHSRAELARKPAQEAATAHYEDELARYTSPREWWHVATLPGGEPVGFVLPAHNGYSPIIAYLAVLPEHRGNGFIDDLLAYGTRVLAARDGAPVRASTDVGNIPMANAFQRVGYAHVESEIDMTWE